VHHVNPTDRLRDWAGLHAELVPLPGSGWTWPRLQSLAALAGEDLAFGRLAEGHLDALAILAEADVAAVSGSVYGVWAARSSLGDLHAELVAGEWSLTGDKAFCSGAGALDRALVTADGPDGPRLFDVDLRTEAVIVVEGSWPAVGMAGSASETITFNAARADRPVGPAGFYTGRPGFWWGAVGVAACWYGGAAALVDGVGRALRVGAPGDTELAPYGAAAARCTAMEQTLRGAAERIDEHGDGADARLTALLARETVHHGCSEVLSLAAAAGGARPICLDADQSRRSADLYAYLAQYHPGRDTADLGRQLLAGRISTQRSAPPVVDTTS
jgi:alkylation response protein AidB-like acyl-CoA dehydrogenase